MAFLEADHRAHLSDHAQHGWRQRGALQPQRPVAGAKTAVARAAVVVGPIQGQNAQGALERLPPPLDITRRGSAATGRDRTHIVGGVRVESLFDCARRHTQRFPAGRDLNRFQIPTVDASRPYELLDFRADLGFERRFEAPFLAAPSEAACGVSSSASAHLSQASQYASICLRNS